MNLYIKCPNIEASMYAQTKLRDVFGFQILKENNDPHFTDRFVVVTPPEWCGDAENIRKSGEPDFYIHRRLCQRCKDILKYKDDKPVICSYKTSIDREGNLAGPDDHNWIDMLDAIALISAVTPRI